MEVSVEVLDSIVHSKLVIFHKVICIASTDNLHTHPPIFLIHFTRSISCGGINFLRSAQHLHVIVIQEEDGPFI